MNAAAILSRTASVVSAAAWGQGFPDKSWVNAEAVQLLVPR